MRLAAFLLTLIIRGLDANSLICPELGESSSISEDNLAWACELKSWRISMAEWKDLVERECSTNGEYWQSSFECPDYSNVTCRNEHTTQHDSDEYDCHTVACIDGRYSDQKAIRRIWRKHFNAYKNIFEFYQKELRFCNPRDCSEFDASTEEPSTATAMEETTVLATQYGEVRSRDECLNQSQACFWTHFNETANGIIYDSAVEMCEQSSSVVAVIPDKTTFDDILSSLLPQTLSNDTYGFVWTAHTYNVTTQTVHPIGAHNASSTTLGSDDEEKTAVAINFWRIGIPPGILGHYTNLFPTRIAPQGVVCWKPPTAA